MKEKLKKLPIESWMGVIWLILAGVITIFQPESKIEYTLNIILGFMALFTGTILMKLNKIYDEIKSLNKETECG